MTTVLKPLGWALFLSVAAGMVAAQDTAPPPAPSAATSAKTAAKSSAQIDAGEPRANTAPTSPDPPPAAGGVPAPARAVAAPVAGSPKAVRSESGSRPSVAGPKAGAQDRLDLGTATVTGDREQPKVMYIVPWKKSDVGDLSGKPLNSLLDEALAPVDRDEFKREVAYYDAVNADTSQNGAPSPAKQGEK